jgi:hypothetical protein
MKASFSMTRRFVNQCFNLACQARLFRAIALRLENGIRVGAKDISLHLDKGGDVNAFSMIIFPETEYGRYLSKNYGNISVTKEGKLCIKYYSNTLPELKVASDSLCEALVYNQI